jgi:hypothetical protein
VIVVIAWGIAAAIALIVLGFCAYEVFWKLNRLAGDLARLRSVLAGLTELQADLSSAAARLPARDAGR